MARRSETKTFVYDNCIVRVHFPDLADDERKKREKALYDAAKKLLEAVVYKKDRKD